MKKYFELNIRKALFIFLFLAVACSKNSLSPSNPVITTVSGDSLFPGAIITIYGSNLGLMADSGSVYFDGTASLSSGHCIKWNNNFITLSVPEISGQFAMYIIVNGDTTNSVSVNIGKLPALPMVEIPAGTFQMGSVDGLNYEEPVHSVTLTKAFFISSTEINQQLWELVTGANNSSFKDKMLPAENIGWIDAVLFCNRLSVINGFDTCYEIKDSVVSLRSNSNGFRLPTEAEWEYACRAGSAIDFSGDGILDDMGWYNGNSGYMPHPTSQKQANGFGLYDMHGNVWEWCWDWYDPNYYSVSPTKDPQGPVSGTRHVLRGGSWQDGPTFARSSARSFPDTDYESVGIRVVRNK